MEALHLSSWSSIGKQLHSPLANTDPLNSALLLEKNMVAWRENIVVSTQSTVVPLYFIQFKNALFWRANVFLENLLWWQHELASLTWGYHIIKYFCIISLVPIQQPAFNDHWMCAWKENQEHSFGRIRCLFYFLAILHKYIFLKE